MIAVTFHYLMPDTPSHGTGFHLDGEYAGYIGQSPRGWFIYFTPFYWHDKRIRAARGYVSVDSADAALALLRHYVSRLAYRQLMSRTRAIVRSQCAKSFYQLVLDNNCDSQRRLSRLYIDWRTWNDPGIGNQKSDLAFTPECASRIDVPPVRTRPAVFRVYPALTYNLIHYTDGSTRRISAADIQAGAEPRPVDPAFPLARSVCDPFPAPQATPSPRAFFLPTTVPPLLAGRHHAVPAAPTTTRNTQ